MPSLMRSIATDWGRIVASLIRLVRDFDVAEEAAQEAFAAALAQWRTSGVPDSPQAWILQTARHKAIDRIRRKARFCREARSVRHVHHAQGDRGTDLDTATISR